MNPEFLKKVLTGDADIEDYDPLKGVVDTVENLVDKHGDRAAKAIASMTVKMQSALTSEGYSEAQAYELTLALLGWYSGKGQNK